jgi:hypothetical protein
VTSFSIILSRSTMDLFFSIKKDDCFFKVGLVLELDARKFGEGLAATW